MDEDCDDGTKVLQKVPFLSQICSNDFAEAAGGWDADGTALLISWGLDGPHPVPASAPAAAFIKNPALAKHIVSLRFCFIQGIGRRCYFLVTGLAATWGRHLPVSPSRGAADGGAPSPARDAGVPSLGRRAAARRSLSTAQELKFSLKGGVVSSPPGAGLGCTWPHRSAQAFVRAAAARRGPRRWP